MSLEQERIAIIGAGRAGSAIFHGLREAGHIPALLWTRSSVTAAAARAEGFPAETSLEWPDLRPFSLILLAVSDTMVPHVAAQLATRLPATTTVAHLSGALDLSPLAALAGAGLSVGSLHPLVSVATRRTCMSGAAAAVAASTPEADERLSAVAEALGLLVIRPTGDRARYHAAACIVGNFPQVLLEAATQLLLDAGLTRDEARRALGPLLEGAAKNAAQLGPAAGLTGPIARGDAVVVRRHLRAIADKPAVELLYRVASSFAVDLARERHVEGLEAIDALLESD